MTHCPHFPACGGCAFEDRHAIDKRARLQAALQRAGYEVLEVAALVEVPLRTRRRVDLAVARKGPEILLGLHQARSADIVDMHECVLVRPEILALLAPLRALLRSLRGLKRAGSVVINWLDNGPDILLRLDADAPVGDRTRMAAFAEQHRVARVSVALGKDTPEPVAMRMVPEITFAGAKITPAPGGFLQASAEGEAAIVAAVLEGLGKLPGKARIAELFCGCGTLSFALGSRARVEAYEGDAAAASALDKAVRAQGLAPKIAVSVRDLSRRPLQPRELDGRAALVLDPPFAGAAAQMRFIAMSKIPRVVYVSCNPEALAADISVLRRAGYRLVGAQPIDQFPFSENVESVVTLALR